MKTLARVQFILAQHFWAKNNNQHTSTQLPETTQRPQAAFA